MLPIEEEANSSALLLLQIKLDTKRLQSVVLGRGHGEEHE